LAAVGLNSSDQVVGYYYTRINGTYQPVPFIYTPGATTPYAAIPGFTGSGEANAINNAGLVVGTNLTTGNGFVYGSGVLTQVAPLAGSSLIFTGVNSSGKIVGNSSTATSGVSRIVTYTVGASAVTDIASAYSGPASDGYSTTAYGINNSGLIAGLGVATGGASTALSSTTQEPFIATPATGGSYTYNDVGPTIDSAAGATGYSSTGGIDALGNIAGGYVSSGSGSSPYIFNASTSALTTITGLGYVGGVANVGGTPEVVGNYYGSVIQGGASVHQYLPYAYQNGTITNLQNYDPPNITFTNAVAVNSNGDILVVGTSGTGATDYFLLTVNNTKLIYTGAVSNSWDTTSANFSPSNYADGQPVIFDDTATGSTSVNIPSVVTPGGVTFNNSSKSYVISGSGIAGGVSSYLSVTGGGTVTLNNSNTYTGVTNVFSGKLVVGPTGSIASGTINISAAGSLRVQNGGMLAATQTFPGLALTVGGTLSFDSAISSGQMPMQISALSIAGSTNSWTGKLDIGNASLDLYRGNLSQITNQVKSGFAGGTWQGSGGITSAATAADSTHLTAIGVIQDSVDQTNNGASLYTTFNGLNVYSNDVLAEVTYYGDANLDGEVDGSDYSRIDAAFLNNQNSSSPAMTGWFNGDFNYDGVINGSDYTLIDNAFNSQGADLGGGVNPDAEITAQISSSAGTSAVPEPAALGLLGAAVLGALRRRPRARRSVSDGQPIASTEC
jgi:autotransporter-associated beta strand protein